MAARASAACSSCCHSLHLQLQQLAMLITVCMSILCSNAADISIQVRDLAAVDTATALGFMSGITMDKGGWLQLGNSSVHPEAFLRFLLLGAPGEGVFPNNSWKGPEKKDVLREGHLLATREASIVESSSHQESKDLGKLDITAWMLGFVCADSISPCRSLAPVAIVNRTGQQTSAPNAACLEFTVVWEKLVSGRSNLVVNTVAAKLINTSNIALPIPAAQLDEFSFKVLSEGGMEACPSTYMQVALRSALDATYNYGPYECHEINQEFQKIAGTRYLLVLGMQNLSVSSGGDDEFGVDAKGPAAATAYSAVPVPQRPIPSRSMETCTQHWLQTFRKVVSLGKCNDSPLLLVGSNADGLQIHDEAVQLLACRNSGSPVCLQLHHPDGNDMNETVCNDIFFLAFNNSFEPAQDGDDGAAVKPVNFSAGSITSIEGSSNYGLPTGNLCEMAGGVFKGSNTTSAEDIDALGYDNNPVAVDAEAMGLLFAALTNQYAQAHGNAFQLQRGSATDFYLASFVLVGSAISVLTATVPFTNFLLKLLVKVLGGLPGSHYRQLKIMLLSLLNMALATVSYAALVGVIVSEKEREKEFKTWAIIAESVVGNANGLQLQALYVVHGQSVYTSKLLIFCWIWETILVITVGGMTYKRCHDVLRKLQLIEQKESSPIPLVDDYKAIEMGMAEYTQLLYQEHDADELLTTPSDLHVHDHGSSHDAAAKLNFKQVALVAWSMEAIKKCTKNEVAAVVAEQQLA